MISILVWKNGHKGLMQVPATELLARTEELQASQSVVWIDLENPTPEEEQLVLGKFCPVHSLSLQDITRPRRRPDAQPHLPKAEEFEDYLLVIVNPLHANFLAALERAGSQPIEMNGSATTQLSAVLKERLLVTHHYESIGAVAELRSYVARHPSQSARGPDFLFHQLLDSSVDQFVPALDHVENALDEVEIGVFDRPRHELLQTLLILKRLIMLLRKTLIYEREVVARLSRGDFQLIDARELVYYRNVYDHLLRFNDLIENSREMVTDLMQTHLAAVSNKLNEIMKVLAMISTIILPMTLITGVYGMNFEHMPELKWALGYPLSVIAMVLVALGAVMFFRWRKWL